MFAPNTSMSFSLSMDPNGQPDESAIKYILILMCNLDSKDKILNHFARAQDTPSPFWVNKIKPDGIIAEIESDQLDSLGDYAGYQVHRGCGWLHLYEMQ